MPSLHSTTAITLLPLLPQAEGYDTYVRQPTPPNPWWLTSNFAERSLMPRRFRCSEHSRSPGICTLKELRGLLPSLQESGYSVLNIDWPVWAGPDQLYEGFGIYNATAVDPLLGNDDDWRAFAGDVHGRGMRLIADFNPSYFYTGAPDFRRAAADVAAYGLHALPNASPARWFRWSAACPGAKEQPPDDDPRQGLTDGWVHSPEAGACYWAVFGGDAEYGGQPTGDLASPEWRRELTAVLTHWVVERGLDGFVLDAPQYYLASAGGVHDGLHDHVTAAHVRETIVEPMHALGAAVFGEVYNFQRPTVAKMLDGGRNTDMPNITSRGRAPGVPGFPSLLHNAVVEEDASGLEGLLVSTVDRWSRWCGTGRTEPHSGGPADVAGLKAAVTALLAGYYVVRAGPSCNSPWGPGYGPIIPGDEWPGGCFGDWVGASRVATTLKALPTSRALRPGAPRHAIQILNASGCGSCAYAALRTSSNDAVVVVFNFASAPVEVALEPLGLHGVVGGNSTDLIRGGEGPRVDPQQPWRLALPPRGWTAYSVCFGAAACP